MPGSSQAKVLRGILLLLGAGWAVGCTSEDCSSGSGNQEVLASLPIHPLYGRDAGHPWNRIHSAINTWQVRATGKEYFSSDWLGVPEDPRLLSGKTQGAALCLLESLLAEGGNDIEDPLKKCIFQGTLWLLFDWATSHGRNLLADRAATVMKRVAMTEEEIRSLPDNYALAVSSGKFPEQFDPDHPQRPFLPADLGSANGPWIVLGDGSEDSSLPLARHHVEFFEGRSSITVLLRMPDDRKSGLDYVRRLSSKDRTEAIRVTGFPKGTQVALWRRLLAVEKGGRVVPTSITESLQIRVYDYAHLDKMSFQEFFKVVLDRERLFAGQAGGLVPMKESSLEARHLVFLGTVPPDTSEHAMSMHFATGSCFGCHMASGPNGVSLESYARVALRGLPRPDLTVISREQEEERTVRWKCRTSSFQKLEKLWNRAP